MLIGILALQGDFYEHGKTVSLLGEQYKYVKSSNDLDGISGLILPGGESTAMNIIQKNENLFKNIIQMIKAGMPTLGTCAGAILLAKNIVNDDMSNLKLLDISIERNAYGRQNDSFEDLVSINHMSKEKYCFIRAPKIKSVGDNVEIIAKLNKEIVGVKQENIAAFTFHPELSPSPNYLSWLNNFLHKEERNVRAL